MKSTKKGTDFCGRWPRLVLIALFCCACLSCGKRRPPQMPLKNVLVTTWLQVGNEDRTSLEFKPDGGFALTKAGLPIVKGTYTIDNEESLNLLFSVGDRFQYRVIHRDPLLVLIDRSTGHETVYVNYKSKTW